MAVDRLNQLRSGEGASPLHRLTSLDQIARDRAVALAASSSLWHAAGGGEGAVESDLRSAGFTGQVAEVALSVPAGHEDLLGQVLQALLTDPANREVVMGQNFRLAGFGSADDGATWYVVGVLAENGPSE
jgi:uncharacterized protein YkwD